MFSCLVFLLILRTLGSGAVYSIDEESEAHRLKTCSLDGF